VQLNTFVRGFEMITQTIEKAVDTYAQFDASVLRAQFFLSEFGHSVPTQEISEFARQLSLATGESQGQIAALEGYLSRFRATSGEIERATKILTNASQATGVPIEHLGHMIERARLGHARGLWDELGIQVKGFEGQIYSLNQIMDIVDQHTRGFSDQFGSTLPGEMKKASAAVEDLTIQFGRLFSPIFLAVLEAFTEIVRGMADAFSALADAAGIATPGLEGAGAAASSGGGASRGEDYLQQITFNTGPQGPLAQALTGGGSYGEPGRGGISVRDFTVAFRHVR
jgi:hypothetical protein